MRAASTAEARGPLCLALVAVTASLGEAMERRDLTAMAQHEKDLRATAVRIADSAPGGITKTQVLVALNAAWAAVRDAQASIEAQQTDLTASFNQSRKLHLAYSGPGR